MKHFWQQLNERERRMLLLCITAVSVYLFYILVYAPLTHAISYKKTQLAEKISTLAWMKKINQTSLKKNKRSSVNTSQLLSLITKELKSPEFNLYPYQLQQTGQGDVQLSFTEVPYPLLMPWLWKLNQHYALQIKQINLDSTAKPGIISALLVMSVD